MLIFLLHIFFIIENLIKSSISPRHKYKVYSTNIHFISKVQVTGTNTKSS